jgi:hypothetical protein
MSVFLTGVFFILHGLVHLLYFGQSQRVFELRPKMVWPDGSWAFSSFLGNEAIRWLASIALVLTVIGFVVSGIGMFAQQAWWRPVVASSAIFSSMVYILFWNGRLQMLDDQGGIGILINVAILMAVLILRWPL